MNQEDLQHVQGHPSSGVRVHGARPRECGDEELVGSRNRLMMATQSTSLSWSPEDLAAFAAGQVVQTNAERRLKCADL